MGRETLFTASSPNLDHRGFARFKRRTSGSPLPRQIFLFRLREAFRGETRWNETKLAEDRQSIFDSLSNFDEFWLEFSWIGMFRTKLGMLAKVTPMMKHPKRPEKKNSWTFMMSKLVFNLAGYNRYGLYSDDVIYHDSPVVKEALRRLPKEVLDARNFRYFRVSC